jgi:hypothetical protein
MPLKTKEERAAFMRRWRKARTEVWITGETLERLKEEFPSAYELIFGEKKTGKKWRKRT